MNRTPIFLLNGTLVVVLFPAIFIVMAAVDTGSRGGGGDAMVLLRMMTSVNPLYTILATALFMTVCGSLNGTSSSTFSREGKQFWVSKIIPVAPREQATAKFLHSYMVAMLGVVTASVVGAAYLRLKATHLVVAAGLALLAGVLLTAVGMIIDLARPLLDWTNPQKAIKQNFNVLLAMLADIGILTAIFFGVRGLIRARLAAGLVIALLYAVLAGLGAIATFALLRFAEKRYPEIEA